MTQVEKSDPVRMFSRVSVSVAPQNKNKKPTPVRKNIAINWAPVAISTGRKLEKKQPTRFIGNRLHS
jgi:hypothetical protein